VLDWPAYGATKAVLVRVDAHLAVHPRDPEAHYLRACLLRNIGCDAGAADALHAALAIAPDHLGALTAAAGEQRRDGHIAAARTYLERAAGAHPASALAHVNLANLLAGIDVEAALREYSRALDLQPDMREAHRGLCTLQAARGDAAAAARHRERGYAGDATATLPYRGERWPVPALLLLSTDGGNLYAGQLLDDRTYQSTALYVESFDPAAALPPHATIVNGIADPDRCPTALELAYALVEGSRARVINHPRAVLASTRAANAARFAAIAGVRTPWTAPFLPDALPAFPFLLRVLGHHMGRHFELIHDRGELDSAMHGFPPGELLAAEFLDARGNDGLYRKYRVMAIGGDVYPLHLAISENWNVHYFSAGMFESQAHRDEERAFLDDMDASIGERAAAAVREIARTLCLDYAGIDFGVDRAGDVLFFEANAAMTVIEPGPDERWAYRRAPARRVLEAMTAMMLPPAPA
jgi:tetratricopeptide (TPR) repeat protein